MFEVIVLLLLFVTVLIWTASTWGQQKRVFVNKDVLASVDTNTGGNFEVVSATSCTKDSDCPCGECSDGKCKTLLPCPW